MRLVVTGAGGMLGQEVVGISTGVHEILAFDHASLDIGDAAAVSATLDASGAECIINCAAYTAVDNCESNTETAYRINSDGPANLAAVAHRLGARLVHVSTDYVFDGTKPTPYVETDKTNPQSVYGASKLSGEHAVLELGHAGIVARTAWVFGQHGANMVKTVLRIKDTVPTLSFVDDQRGSPTSAADLATMLIALADSKHSGLFHVTNAGNVSWFEFVQQILALTGDDPARVLPIKTSDLSPPRPAPRPANSVLDNAALRACGLAPLRSYEAALADVITQLTI